MTRAPSTADPTVCKHCGSTGDLGVDAAGRCETCGKLQTTRRSPRRRRTKPKPPTVPELMGAAEVADELGVAGSNLARVPNLPSPVVTYLRRGNLWLAAEVRAFAADRRKRNAA